MYNTPSKLVVTYSVMVGRPAESTDPGAVKVPHRGYEVHAIWDRTVEQIFSYPADTAEGVYTNPKALSSAAHKAIQEKVKVGVDEPDYFIPMFVEVAKVEAR